MEIPYKTKNRTTIWHSNPTPGHIHREKQNLKRYKHSNVHHNTIYNSQDMAIVTEEWIKKKRCGVCIYLYIHTWNTHIYTHTMEYTCVYIYTHTYIYTQWNTHVYKVIWRHMDGPRDCQYEWSMSDTKRQILYDINYMWILKKKRYKWTYLQNRIRVTDVENNL